MRLRWIIATVLILTMGLAAALQTAAGVVPVPLPAAVNVTDSDRVPGAAPPTSGQVRALLASEVWVDDGYCTGCGNDGHTWGTDAFATIQAGIDAVDAGGTVHVAAGSYAEALTISKSVSVLGASPADTKVNLPSGNTGIVTVAASDVLLQNLWIYKSDSTDDVGMISVPKGAAPAYAILYHGLTIDNCRIDGGRYGTYCTIEDLTVRNSTFANHYRNAIVLAGVAGTTTIEHNHFVGLSTNKQMIYMTTGPGLPYDSGTINIAYNTHTGPGSGADGGHFFLIDYWGWDGTNKVNLTFQHNSIDAIGTRRGVVFYGDAQDWAKFGTVAVKDNIFSNAGPAVLLDFASSTTSGVPAGGQISAQNNLTYLLTPGSDMVTDGTGSFGYRTPAPDAASMSMYSLSGNLSGDPQYTDPTHGAGRDDFAIGASSPAVHAATDSTNIGQYQSLSPPPVTWADPTYGPGSAGGHTWGYDAFDNIQDAIDAVADGGLVNVNAGTYVENLWINKPLELAGAGASSVTVYPAVSLPNPCAGSSLCGSRTAASNIILTEASDITIHGLTLDGANTGLTSGLVRGGADLDARNGIIEYGPAGVFDNLVVYETTIKNIYLRGIYANSYGSGFHFYDNTVQNVQGESNSIAIFNFGGSGIIEGNTVSDANDAIAANHSRGTQFLDNTVTSSGSGVHSDNNGSMGGTADLIQGNDVTCSGVGYGVWVFYPYRAVTLDENTVTNCDVGLSAWAQGAAVTSLFTENTVTGPAKAAGSVGAYITTDSIGWGYTDVSADLRNNIITNFDYAVYLTADEQSWNPDPYEAKTIYSVFYGNSFGGNTYGMTAGTDGTYNADASANWWGSADPATVKAAANGGAIVDYTPWLASGDDKSADPGFQGDFATLWVDDDSPQTGTGGRIQEGIDLVSGSTVNVAAGTYEEQVVIARNLTLLGQGTSSIIKAPATVPTCFTTSAANKPIVCIKDGATATVNGFTIDGAGRGNANSKFEGVAFRNAGGTVRNCTIQDIRDTPFSGGQHGVAIYAYNTDEIARTVNVWDNVIIGFQKNAMALNAGDTTPLVVDVQRNEVTGAGATTITAQNGIQVWADLASGTVAYNEVSGIAYDNTLDSTKWVATSILNYYGDLDIVHNTVTGAHMAVYNIDGAGDINDNDLTIEKIGVYAYGICATDPPEAVPSPYGAEDMDKAGPLSAPDAHMAATLSLDISGNEVTFSGTDNTATYGIEADAGYGADNLAVTADDNTVTGFEMGIAFYQCQPGCDTGVFTSLSAHGNCLSGNTYGMWTNVTRPLTDGTLNWWGNDTGPYHATQNAGGLGDDVSDNIDFEPWITDGCGGTTTTGHWKNVRTGAFNDLAGSLAAAHSGDTIEGVCSGSTPIPGGGTANIAHVTIDLNGCVVGPGSSFLIVNADDVTVLGPGILDGAGSTDPAIVVKAGADNFILQGVEIRLWSDGVVLEGSVVSFKMGENFIHDNTDTGLEVQSGTTLGGVVTIEGNLFKDNGGLGVVHNGVGTLPAAYNSWGDLAGPTGPLGDGVGTNVTYIPWTFAEIFFDLGSVTAYVQNLQPSWTASGGGGVYSAYVGPPAYGYVSPGSTALYDGREAGIIKAGLNPDPDDGHYWDEGLFGFIPNVTIENLAAATLSYDVETQAGVNPVWMTIEIDTGVVGDRNDNTTYQHVPTSNPAGWHTVDAAAGLWQKWNNNDGDVTGNPKISLSAVATAHPGCNVVRAYLRLGMGDSYNNGGTGTIAWVDKAVIGGATYDFVLGAPEEVVRHVMEGAEFDVELKADAAKLYGLTFVFTYDTAKLTLGTTTFAAPWAGRCAALPGLPAGTIGYFCSLLNEAPTPDAEWDADGGIIATFHFTAKMGPPPPDNGPWTALFDISHLETDTSASAIGGQKVFINNAGFNDPTIPQRDITDTDGDDGQIIIHRGANYTGFVDLQGRLSDGLAWCRAYNQATIAGATKLAEGASASSGQYTTAWVAPGWLGIGNTYYLVVDRWLFLSTTAFGATSFGHNRILDAYPVTGLPSVYLLGGDATNDERILVNDLSCIGGDYGKTSGFNQCGGTGLSDVNEDGRVNVQDLSLAGGNLYKTYSPWTVP